MSPAAKKKEKTHGPGIVGLAASLVISALVGAIAAFSLEYRLVPEFLTPQEAADRSGEESARPGSEVILGSEAAFPGWRDSIETLAAGTQTGAQYWEEGQLNALAGSFLDFSSTKEKAKLQDVGSNPFKLFPETPNFRVDEGLLQIVLPLEIDLFGMEDTPTLVVRGDFVESKDGYRFRVKEMRANEARVPTPLGKIFLSRLWSAIQKSGTDDTFNRALAEAGQIKVEGRELVVIPK